MAIAKLAGAGGNFVKDPGEYIVTIKEAKSVLTKTKKEPMLTVVFETQDEKLINSYFVKSVEFHMAALNQLKISAGLKITDTADQLVGKKVGILVEPQTPKEGDTKVFMQVTGYGKASEVTEASFQTQTKGMHSHLDEVPF